MLVYYAILTTIFVACIAPKHYARPAYYLIFGFLFLFSSLRSSTVDNDYLGYLEYYHDSISGIFWNIEPSFIIIAKFINSASLDPRWLFAIYDFFGLLVLMIAISRIEKDRLTVLMFFFSGHFLLWPMTQIRVGLAGSIFLYSLVFLSQSKRFKYNLCATLAVFFHYLSFVLYVLTPINDKILSLWRISIIILVGLFIYLSGFNMAIISSFVPVELIALKLLSYEEQKSLNDNIFNSLLIARLIFLIIMYSLQNQLKNKSPYFIILLKVYIAAIFIHIAFGASPLSSRVSELLLIVEPILLTISSRLIKDLFLSRIAVYIISFLYLSFNLFYVKLINSYDIYF